MILPNFSSKEFDVNSRDKSFSADASQLTRGRSRNLFGRVYNDACDVGFAIVSSRTGKAEKFVDHKEVALEGEIIAYWILKPTSRAANLAGWTATVFND